MIGEGGQPVKRINELELVDGLLYANVFGSNNLLVIEPDTGIITKRYNMRSLLQDEKTYIREHNIVWSSFDKLNNVMNGIAYHAASDTFFVTGKNWHYLY